MPEIKCPTKEQILSAAKEDCVVKKALEKLFPEAFEPELLSCRELQNAMYPRFRGKYVDKGILIDAKYNWQIVTDDVGAVVLIATKKSQ